MEKRLERIEQNFNNKIVRNFYQEVKQTVWYTRQKRIFTKKQE